MTAQDKVNLWMISFMALLVAVQLALLVWAVAISSEYVAFQSGCLVLSAGQLGMCFFNWRLSK